MEWAGSEVFIGQQLNESFLGQIGPDKSNRYRNPVLATRPGKGVIV